MDMRFLLELGKIQEVRKVWMEVCMGSGAFGDGSGGLAGYLREKIDGCGGSSGGGGRGEGGTVI